MAVQSSHLLWVFPKPIVLTTTKPRNDEIYSLHIKVRLGGETIALGKTCISAITSLFTFLLKFTNQMKSNLHVVLRWRPGVGVSAD